MGLNKISENFNRISLQISVLNFKLQRSPLELTPPQMFEEFYQNIWPSIGLTGLHTIIPGMDDSDGRGAVRRGRIERRFE